MAANSLSNESIPGEELASNASTGQQAYDVGLRIIDDTANSTNDTAHDVYIRPEWQVGVNATKYGKPFV